MAQQTINIGSAANDGTGDPARTAFGKINDNFDELYDAVPISGYYNVLRHGVVADDSTNNASALQALIDSIPFHPDPKASAIFIWPHGTTSSYVFNSKVSWGAKAIKNIGIGTAPHDNYRLATTIKAGANGITMFEADGGTGGHYFTGPSFENMFFDGNGFTGLTLMKFQRIMRCGLFFCGFRDAVVGLELDENAVDCAAHHFIGNGFVRCETGVHSTKSNHLQWWGGDFEDCDIGIHLAGLTNFWTILGGQWNLKDNQKGIKIDGSGHSVIGSKLEMTVGTDGCVAIEIEGDDTILGGYGNEITAISLSGGDDGSSTNVGIDILAGANDNQVDWAWAESFNPTTGAVIQDAGKRNRIAKGGFCGAVADRPTNTNNRLARYPGVTHYDPATNILSVCDGTAWDVV